MQGLRPPRPALVLLSQSRLPQAGAEAARVQDHSSIALEPFRPCDPVEAVAFQAPYPLQLPPVEGRPSVNLALSQVIQALANGAIETGRARLLLYTLEIASRNFRAEALYRANTSTAGLTA